MDSISALRARQEQADASHARIAYTDSVVGHIEPETDKQKEEKKIGGLGFWCIVLLAMTKDVADVFLTGTVILAFISTIISVFVICVVTFYFFYNDVSLFTTKKLATYLITAVIDFVPYLAVLPSFTTMVFAIRFLENNALLRKTVEIKEAGGGLALAGIQALYSHNFRGAAEEDSDPQEEVYEKEPQNKNYVHENEYKLEREEMDRTA